MLVQNASDRHRIKNKWNNQRIHKKCNQIQYASKHYWLDNDIIFKRKNPVKQRKDRKKFKTQRARKKVYKRMSFDYDDFMYRNKNENFKRIQTRPTIQRQCTNHNISAIYDCYYNNPPTNKRNFKRIINGINIKQNGIISYRNDLKKSKELNSHYRICLVCKRYVLKYKCAKILCKYCLLYLTEYTNYGDQCHYLIYRICVKCVCKNDRFCVRLGTNRKCVFKYCTVCKKSMSQKDKEQCSICNHFFCGININCGFDQKCKYCSAKQERIRILQVIEQYSNHSLYANITQIISKYALGYVFGCSNRVNCNYKKKQLKNRLNCLKMIVIDNFSTFSISIDYQNNYIYYYYIEDKYLPENKDTLNYINGKYIRIFCSNCSNAPYTLRNCRYSNCTKKDLYCRQPNYCFNHPACHQCSKQVFDHARPCTVCKTYLCHRCAHKEFEFEYRRKYGKCKKCYYERNNKIVLELLKTTLMSKYNFNTLVIQTIYNYYIGFSVMCGCCKKWISFTDVNDVLDSQNIYEMDKKYIYTYSAARIYDHRKNLFVDINDDKNVFRVFCKKCTNLLTNCDIKCMNYDVKPKGHDWFVCYNHRRRFYKCNRCKKCGYGGYPGEYVGGPCTEDTPYYTEGKSSKCEFCHESLCGVCMTGKAHLRADDLIKTIQTESFLRIDALKSIRKNKYIYKQSSRRKTKNRNKNISYWKRKSDRKGNAVSIAKWKLSNQPMNIKSIRL